MSGVRIVLAGPTGNDAPLSFNRWRTSTTAGPGARPTASSRSGPRRTTWWTLQSAPSRLPRAMRHHPPHKPTHSWCVRVAKRCTHEWRVAKRCTLMARSNVMHEFAWHRWPLGAFFDCVRSPSTHNWGHARGVHRTCRGANETELPAAHYVSGAYLARPPPRWTSARCSGYAYASRAVQPDRHAYASRAARLHPNGGQFDSASSSALTPHGVYA